MTLEQIKNMNNLLSIKKLSLSINSEDEEEILKDVSFDIKESEVVSLIGESGSGKSITALSIIRLLEKSCKIKKGKTDRLVNIKDIAPTISSLLGISFPNGCTGNPIVEITE